MEDFSKVLTVTDIISRFLWPTDYLHLLPRFKDDGFRVDFGAIDADGRFWKFTCTKRRKSPYMKPVLSSSTWLRFVRAKGLSVNDKVVFYYEPDKPVNLKIRVRKLKTIRLMGVDITAYAQEE